jgi:hypothetical protein
LLFNHGAEQALYSHTDPFHCIRCHLSLSAPSLLGIHSIPSTYALFFDAMKKYDERRARHVHKLRVESMDKLPIFSISRHLRAWRSCRAKRRCGH